MIINIGKNINDRSKSHMTFDQLSNLYFEYQQIAFDIAKTYKNYDLDIVTDLAVDGLLRAVYSVEDRESIEGFDFKTYALFYIKGEINQRLNEV
jgi:DNA-directed RNA polymerase sigma subunit (sigma70/sigma32)